MYGEPENSVPALYASHEPTIPFVNDEKRRLWSVAARYADGLPASSGAIFRLNDLVSEGPADLKAIVGVLSSDPSMAAQVVRLAHADAIQEQEGPYTLDDCVVFVGVGRLRSLVLTTPLAPTDYVTAIALQALRQHSHLTARIGERIARACGYPEPFKANIAGLLHDIGEVPVYLEGRQRGGNTDTGDVDHSVVGGWLARLWKLPPFLVDAIEHHHDPTKARHDPFLTAITAAADEACRVYGVGLQMQPAAHRSLDCIAALERHLTFLSREGQVALAALLHKEFLEWVKARTESSMANDAIEGKWELWQSAL